MKTVLLVAGWMSTPERAWAPWLMRQLRARGAYPRFCQLPLCWMPNTWLGVRRLRKMAQQIVGQRVIVCHSFGAKVALVALSRGYITADAMIMVSPLYRWPFTVQITPWRNFVDFDAVKANCPKLAIVHSKDDPLVPRYNGTELRRLFAKHGIEPEVAFVNGRGHFSHCLDLPEVLEMYDSLVASA